MLCFLLTVIAGYTWFKYKRNLAIEKSAQSLRKEMVEWRDSLSWEQIQELGNYKEYALYCIDQRKKERDGRTRQSI